MNPVKLISDYLDKAKSHVYGIFVFWLITLHLPVIFTAMFVDQGLLFQKSRMLKDEYIRSKYFNDLGDVAREVILLAFSVLMTWLMIWFLPKTLVAKAYARELEDQYEREFQKIDKDKELEERKQKLADEQLNTASKIKDVVKEEGDIEQLEKETWDKEFKRFSKSNLANILPSIEKVIYQYKGHIGKYYDKERGITTSAQVGETDIAIAHSNNLVDLDTTTNKIQLTEKGKYFLSLSYYDRLP